MDKIVSVNSRIKILSVDSYCPELPIVEGGGRAIAVVWPGNGGRDRTMHLFELAADSATVTQTHGSEAAYYVVRGSGQVGDGAASVNSVHEGSMVHVGPDTAYRFEAGGDGMVVLGGPCPFDPALYAAIGLPTGHPGDRDG